VNLALVEKLWEGNAGRKRVAQRADAHRLEQRRHARADHPDADGADGAEGGAVVREVLSLPPPVERCLLKTSEAARQ
jgi:hypothetical protein